MAKQRIIFLVTLLCTFHSSRGLKCYQCTNIPNFYNATGCKDSLTDNFLRECVIPTFPTTKPINGTVKNSEPGWSNKEDFLQKIFESQTIKNQRAISPKRLIKYSNAGWYCGKAIAETNHGKFVIRGCTIGVSMNVPDRCEYMDYEYTFINNITMTKAHICLCDSEGCNKAVTNKSKVLFYLPIIYFAQKILHNSYILNGK